MLLERLVQEGPDLFGVANRGHTAYMLPCVLQDEVGEARRISLVLNPPRPDSLLPVGAPPVGPGALRT